MNNGGWDFSATAVTESVCVIARERTHRSVGTGPYHKGTDRRGCVCFAGGAPPTSIFSYQKCMNRSTHGF